MERSSTYIFIYSIVLVVLVAAGLSITSISLKDKQNANVENEKMQNILMSIGIQSEGNNVQKDYNTYIKETYILQNGVKKDFIIVKKGSLTDTLTAFNIDMKELYKKPASERELPVFVAEKNGERFSVIPLRGKGLWGPVWGYISIKDDNKTVAGAVFDHQGETPGLGAEINKDKFEQQFNNKLIFDENNSFTSVKVIKGGAGNNAHGVDAISGGTITSNGVNNMIDTCLRGYITFFTENK